MNSLRPLLGREIVPDTIFIWDPLRKDPRFRALLKGGAGE